MKKEYLYKSGVQTPYGRITLTFYVDPFVLKEILLPGAAPESRCLDFQKDGSDHAKLDEMIGRIMECIEGRNSQDFWQYLSFDGLSPLQAEVLRKVAQIPYGELATYKDIAVAIGRPRACRFVGSALAKNPYPILIPCHRIIRSDLSIGGFGGGTALKQKMINYERSSAEARILRNPSECDTSRP